MQFFRRQAGGHDYASYAARQPWLPRAPACPIVSGEGPATAAERHQPCAGETLVLSAQRAAGWTRGAAVNGYRSRASVLEGDLIAGLRKTVLAAQPGADVESIRRAFDVAAYCHEGQTRRSGDPHITHPVSVAAILAGLGADDQTVCTAVEDTPYSLTALRRDFGAGIAAPASRSRRHCRRGPGAR
jgi:HD domain